MNGSASTLVAIATYNEVKNLPALVDEIRRYAPQADVLVIDDNSPDGTGRWCDARVATDSHFHVIHRSGKLGLGTASVAGLRYAIENRYHYVLTMDADFSHPPRYIPEILKAMDGPAGPADVVIGSRYTTGGGVAGWPWRRRLMSRGVNLYARWLLRLKTKDCSGAFRCFRVDFLREIDFDQVHSRGYAFFEEFLWLLKRRGARFREVPITFVDRTLGQSKINLREARVAILTIFRLGMKEWLKI